MVQTQFMAYALASSRQFFGGNHETLTPWAFGFRDVAALAEVLVEGARLGLDLGDQQLLDRYQRWRSLDALSVAFATDSLTRIYGVPGKTASAVRRFGMGLVGRISPLRNRLMSEARGTSGELPLLLRGLPI